MRSFLSPTTLINAQSASVESDMNGQLVRFNIKIIHVAQPSVTLNGSVINKRENSFNLMVIRDTRWVSLSTVFQFL